MSLTDDQLKQLTDLVNERLAEWEFPHNHSGIIECLPPGAIRLVHDVIRQWYEEREQSPATYGLGYKAGYAAGHEDATPLADLPKPAPEHAPVQSNGSTDAPDPHLVSRMPVFNTGMIHQPAEWPPKSDEKLTSAPVPPKSPLEQLQDTTKAIGSAFAGMTAQTAAPLIPRRPPRELADVDSDEDGDEVELVSTRQDTHARPATRLDPEQKAADLRAAIAALQDMAEGNIMPSMHTWNLAKPHHLPRAQAITTKHDLTWSELARYARLEISKPGPKAKTDAAETEPD